MLGDTGQAPSGITYDGVSACHHCEMYGSASRTAVLANISNSGETLSLAGNPLHQPESQIWKY